MGILSYKCEFFHEEIKSEVGHGWLEANETCFLTSCLQLMSSSKSETILTSLRPFGSVNWSCSTVSETDSSGGKSAELRGFYDCAKF